jgi:hypothetical protein
MGCLPHGLCATPIALSVGELVVYSWAARANWAACTLQIGPMTANQFSVVLPAAQTLALTKNRKEAGGRIG